MSVPTMPAESKLNTKIDHKDTSNKTYNVNTFQTVIDRKNGASDLENAVDPDTICGIGSFKPQWIQKYATPRAYLVLFSITGIISGTYSTYLIGCMTTLEKRFAFKSKVTGTIMMVDEITPLFLAMLVGYFGGRSHRPRILGFGMFLSSVCCFISSLPYFIYGPATHLSGFNEKGDKKVQEICNNEFQGESCDADSLPPTMAAVLFLTLGSLLKGFGNMCYYTIGVSYMDDNAKKRNSPMYFGVAFALRLFGPFLGYLMSSFFLNFHEDPYDAPKFGPDDPRWIGGWWMGFLLQGFLLLTFSVPISLFPRRMPGQMKLPLDKSEQRKETAYNVVIGMFAAGKRLIKNPILMLLILNEIMKIFGTFGHYMTLPKYMEKQFGLSASDASLFSGPPGLAAFMVSLLLSGFLIWKFKPTARFLIAVMISLDVIGVVSFLLLMIPRCDHVEIMNSGFNNDLLILENECNIGCNCTTSKFNPVCGPDGQQFYYSPCYAGCQDNLNQTFSNCSCVSDSTGQKRDFVTQGFCVTEDCWSQALAYIIFLPIFQFIFHLGNIAYCIIMLRAVKPQDKSVAMGFFEMVICTFGFIPQPILFGALIDSACLLFENSCGQIGNCWLYDVPKLNFIMHGSCAVFTAISAFIMCGVYCQAGRIENLYDEDEAVDGAMTMEEHKIPGKDEKISKL